MNEPKRKPKHIKKCDVPPRPKSLQKQLNEVRGVLIFALEKVDTLLKCEDLDKESDAAYI